MHRFAFVLLALCCSLPGCAMFNDGKESVDATANALKPRDHDYRDVVNGEFDDEWSGVRKEGRASEPTEQEWDGLTKHMMSPKAMAIERNLGYGYGEGE